MNCHLELDSKEIFEIIKKEKTLEATYVSIMNKYYDNACFDDSQKAVLSSTVQKLSLKLNENNIKFWIDWGTFLGAYRNNNIIPWDKDFDISIMSRDKSKLLSVLNEDSKELSIKEEKENFISLNINEINRGLDIYIWDKIEKSNGTFLDDNFCAIRPSKFFEKLDSIKLDDLGLTLPCPNLKYAKDLLTAAYGKGFMLPPGNPILMDNGQHWTENRGT